MLKEKRISTVKICSGLKYCIAVLIEDNKNTNKLQDATNSVSEVLSGKVAATNRTM